MELIQWEQSPGQLVLIPKSELMDSMSINHQSLQLMTSSKVLPEMKRYDKTSERSCQVEGCNLVLAGAKAYHKKHRVCERHSKAPMVVVKGIEQRFCQQCSRFHLVSEFDDAKRSCRRKLARHNRRRRKNLFDSTPPHLGFPSTSQFGRALSLLSPTKPNTFSTPWVDIEEKPEKQASLSSIDPYNLPSIDLYNLLSHKIRSWPDEYGADKYNSVGDQFFINQAFLEAATQKTQFQYLPCTNFGS